MQATKQALVQLKEKAVVIWKDGRWVGEFKADLLSNLSTGSLIDYLELFDPDFDLDDFILEFITEQNAFIKSLTKIYEDYNVMKEKDKQYIFINQGGIPSLHIDPSAFGGEVGLTSDHPATLIKNIKNSIKRWFL